MYRTPFDAAPRSQAGLWSAEPSRPNIVVFLADDLSVPSSLLGTAHTEWAEIISARIPQEMCYMSLSPARRSDLDGYRAHLTLARYRPFRNESRRRDRNNARSSARIESEHRWDQHGSY